LKENASMAYLHLNLKGIYFDQIKAGTKDREYRLAAKWMKRLAGKTFDGVVIEIRFRQR